jgi:hypothetical protein
MLASLGATLVCWMASAPAAHAYVEIPYTLGRILQDATNVISMRVEKVDKQKNLIVYRKLQDLKGTWPVETIKHVIGQGGFSPREWQTIMAWAEEGKTAIFFHNNSASETCIDNYWYQAYAQGEWWTMSHAEPFFLRSFAGRPDKLAPLVTAMVSGQEVVAPCMVDGDKNALQLGTAKIQRLRASSKLLEYDAKRDFVGWGGEDFRRLAGMPNFSHLGGVGRVDPQARGVAPADFDGDGKLDLCLFGAGRTAILQNAGAIFSEVALPFASAARAAEWDDYNGDKHPDLLIVMPTGPKLATFADGKFRDDTERLPLAPYYSLKSGAWIDYDRDGRPDILLADRFAGLILWRNVTGPGTAPSAKAFVDVTREVGLGPNGIAGKTPGENLVVADVSGDSRPDFYYCAGNGVLVINTVKGFVEAKESGLRWRPGQGPPAFADFDGDKRLDAATVDAAGVHLWNNGGKNQFVEVSAKSADVAAPLAGGRCVLWADFNNDKQTDLFVGCIKGPNRYFENRGNGVLEDRTEAIGFYQRVFNTGGMTLVDLNKDGAPDLVLNNEGQESVVLLGAAATATVDQTAQDSR